MGMMEEGARKYELALPLKGGRTYVRGADIYSAILDIVTRDWADATGRCRLGFHTLPRRRLNLHAHDAMKAFAPPKKAIADFRIGRGEGEVIGFIEETEVPIVEKVAFDEDALLGESSVSGVEIFPSGPRSCPAIDLAVVLTKTLHNKLRPPRDGKWIFTRLDTERPLLPSDTGEMSIALVKELGSRLTRSDIRVFGRGIGSIYFSVGQT
jgi:hypothetical protein